MDSLQIFNMSEAAVVPAVACLTIILCVPPLVWHVKNRNLAASSMVFWIVLTNLFNFANALIWTGDDLDSWWRGYILCDIEVKLMNAANVGMPASLATVLRSLALVLDTERTVVQMTSAQRRRKLAADALLCFGAPIYMIIVHYFVQNIRYYIFAISGCVPGFDNSWPSIALVHIWSPFFAVLACYYSILVVHRVRKYRREFAVILHASNSGLTKSRFQRLFFMCLVLTILGLPVQFYVLYKNCSYPMVPYSWNRIHGRAWWDIILIPTDGTVTFDRWIQLAVGFTVFLFFGLGNDAMKMYRLWLVKLGLGKVFPRLCSPMQNGERRPSTVSHSSSLSSRALDFVKGKLSRSSQASSGHGREDSLSTSTMVSSPNPHPQGFSSIISTEDSISPSTAGPHSSLSEKAITNPHPPLNGLTMPPPVHAAPSRLTRFLAHTRASTPFNGIHALGLFSGAHRRPGATETRMESGM